MTKMIKVTNCVSGVLSPLLSNLYLNEGREIHRSTPVALVLHGGSGIPHEQLRQAVQNGICKINLATETKSAFMGSLRRPLQENSEIDLRKVFPKVIDQIKELISEKLSVLEHDNSERVTTH